MDHQRAISARRPFSNVGQQTGFLDLSGASGLALRDFSLVSLASSGADRDKPYLVRAMCALMSSASKAISLSMPVGDM